MNARLHLLLALSSQEDTPTEILHLLQTDRTYSKGPNKGIYAFIYFSKIVLPMQPYLVPMLLFFGRKVFESLNFSLFSGIKSTKK